MKAESQIALAAPAVLEAVKRFTVGCNCINHCACTSWDPAKQPPLVNLIVEKHKWELRIAYWEARDRIVRVSDLAPRVYLWAFGFANMHIVFDQRITQPANAGETASFEGVCRLLLLIKDIKRWAADTVLPFLIEQLDARAKHMAGGFEKNRREKDGHR